MTVILAKRHKNYIEVGADSRLNIDTNENYKSKKLFLYGKSIILGCAGTGYVSELLNDYIKSLPKLKEKFSSASNIFEILIDFRKKYSSKKYEKCSDFDSNIRDLASLLVVKNKIYYLTCGSVDEIDDEHFGVGCGGVIGVTALRCGKNLKEALDIVCKHANHCSPPYMIRKVKF